MCINTFVNGLYKVLCLFILNQMTKEIHSRDALHKSKAALWLVIEFKGMFFPHKIKNGHESVHLCDSLVQIKIMMWLKEFIVSKQSVELHR